MNENRNQRAVAFLQGAFFPPLPNFRQQLLELGKSALLDPPTQTVVLNALPIDVPDTENTNFR